MEVNGGDESFCVGGSKSFDGVERRKLFFAAGGEASYVGEA